MIEQPLAFLAATLALVLTPGPDQAYILGRTLSQGRAIGIFSVLGVCSGAMLYILAAALGFAVIIRTSKLAYNILLYAGGAYLLFLGISALLSKEVFKPNGQVKNTSKGKAYIQGVLVNILNPKSALFFLAFVPQFMDPLAPNHFLVFITLGAVVVGIAIIWESFLVIFSHRLLSGFIRRPGVARFLNTFMGLIFIGLAIKLLFF